MAKIYIVTYLCNPCDGNVEVETNVFKTKEASLRFIEAEVERKCADIEFDPSDVECHRHFVNVNLPEAYINQWGDMYEWTTKEVDLDAKLKSVPQKKVWHPIINCGINSGETPMYFNACFDPMTEGFETEDECEEWIEDHLDDFTPNEKGGYIYAAEVEVNVI